MKQNLLLALFGLAIGALLTWLCYPLFVRYARHLPQGAEFESVEAFQRAMLQRDSRDTKSNDSVSLRSIITPHHDQRIMYDLLPNLNVKFQDVPVRTNSCGMRGPEISIEKPEGVYRIAFLGDSFTFGWGVEEEQSFVSLTSKILNQKFPHMNVESLNFGVPGYSTFQEVTQFEEKGIDFRPDAVVVFFIDNDFGLPFFIRNIHQPGSVVTGTSFSRALWKGDDDALKEQQRELQEVLDPNRMLLRLAKLLRQNGIELFLAINPRPKWKKDLKRLGAVRKNKWVNVIQMRAPFINLVKSREIPARALSLAHDPHPSPIKHQLLAEVISSALYPSVTAYQDSLSDTSS